MRLRKIAGHEPFIDDPLTGARTRKPGDTGAWWELSVLYPDGRSGGVALFPVVEWDAHGRDVDIEVHWLLWGLALWWQRDDKGRR